jgi:transposase
VLDRFHVMQILSKAIDQTRRDEVRKLRSKRKLAVLTRLPGSLVEPASSPHTVRATNDH